MIPENVEQFASDVKVMRDAQNAYFAAKRNPRFTPEQVHDLLTESKRLEKIVDAYYKEKLPSLFTF